MKRILTPAPKTFETACRKCSCRFSYELSDLSHSYINANDYVSCPSCGEECRHDTPWNFRSLTQVRHA